MISSSARSPWSKATQDLTTACGDHEGRLTPVAFDRSITDEGRVLRFRAGVFDVPEVLLEGRGSDIEFLNYRLLARDAGAQNG